MSQMTEVSKKCDPKLLEENLNKLKECDEYIHKSYQDVKKKYLNEIVDKDQNTDNYKSSFYETLELLQYICKNTLTLIHDLEENGVKNINLLQSHEKNLETSETQNAEKCTTKEHEKTKSTDKESGDKDDSLISNKNIENISEKEKISSLPNTVVGEKENEQTVVENIINGPDMVEQNGLHENEIMANNADSSINNLGSIEKVQEKNLDKENEKPKENLEINKDKEPPKKGIIRLVSIEKLLDPTIAAFHQKPNKRVSSANINLNASVIILDSDEDDTSSLLLQPVSSAKNNTSLVKEDLRKVNRNEERTLSNVINKNTVSHVNEDKQEKNETVKSNPKMRKVNVKMKKIKLINAMLKENVFKINSSEDLLKKFDWAAPNALPHSRTSEPNLQKDKSRESIKIKLRKLKKTIPITKVFSSSSSSSSSSSDSEEDDKMDGRSKLNRSTSRKNKRKVKEERNTTMHDSSSENSSKRSNASRRKKDESSSSSEDDAFALEQNVKYKSSMEKEVKIEKDSVESNSARNKSKACRSSMSKEHSSRNVILSSSSDEDNGKSIRVKNKKDDDTVKQKSLEVKDENPADNSDKNDSSSDSNSVATKKKKDVTKSKEIKSSKSADEYSDNKSDKNDSSSSDSAIRRRKKKKKSTSSAASDKNSDADYMDDDSETEKKKKTRKRKRIRNADDSESSSNEKDSPNKKRKNIRKLLKTKDLVRDTKKATKEEEERKKRIEERQKLYNKIYEKPENVELQELVLDFDEETKAPLLWVDTGILKKLKPHQAAGIKFMWDACFETLKDTNKKPGSGCILAHCMGLGKTLQVVTLTHTLLVNSRKTSIERVLIIAPLSTLTNWAKEYIQWMKFCKKKNIEIYDMSKWRDKHARVHKLNEWFEEGGVCILGYDMYRILTNPKSTTIRKKQRESLQKCLVDPGPDLVVCDEGHLLKNEKTSLSQAVNKMKTQRRIVLTGTPLQNNLKEYYCMIQFIKPSLLGTYKEYLNRFVNPITNGQYTDSTVRDIQLMKNRSHVLHKLLEGCIQRRDYAVLAPYLPPKHEYVVFITLTEMQRKLYEFYMTKQRDINTEAKNAGKGAMLFQDFQNLRRIWTHPMCLRVNSDSVLRKKLLKDFSDSEGSLKDFIDDSDASSKSTASSSSGSSDEKNEKIVKNNKQTSTRRTRGNPDPGSNSDVEIIEEEVKDDLSEWWKAICPEEELNNINHSPKLLLLMEILDSCETIGDKILLFSQSLQSLDVIEHFLSLIDKKTQGDEIEGNVSDFKGSWQPGIDYYRLDGSSTVENREIMCRNFNNVHNLRGRLFLISTRAGSLGINLVAANRVIIFDVSWNPSHDTQSIFRVYRFGQEKPCYIYRFISLGTMEQKVYERQVAKQATAKRVVDEQQIGRHYNQNDLLELYRYELIPNEVREVPALPKDRLFADLLTKYEEFINKYHEHDSLLENEESEILNEEERKAAWAEYQEEKERPAQQQFIAYNRVPYGNVNNPVTSNKHLGFRTDILLRLLNILVRQEFPTLNDNEVFGMVPVYLKRLETQLNSNDVSMYKKLIDLHTQLGQTHGYYIDPTGGPMHNAMVSGINPMALMNQSQGQVFMAQPPPTNSSQVYEVE